jgi:F0F1-type ATP synthase alpha subunit
VKLVLGQSQTCFGQALSEESEGAILNVDLSARLPRAAYRRSLVDKQLMTGHMRLDLARPLTQGNLIVFKGERATGKSHLAMQTVKQFINEDRQRNHAIYVGLNSQAGLELINELEKAGTPKENLLSIGVADETSIAAGEFLFAPKAALHALHKLKEHVASTKNLSCNVLFVFDHVLLHQSKEVYVYGAAGQPQSPVNVINELMEQTGVFPVDGSCVTSIMILDTESTSEQFSASEKKIIDHIESIAD